MQVIVPSKNPLGSEVLPGLQFRMEDLERQTDIMELALDDVYSGYVMPGLRAALAKAAAKKQRASAEAQRADAEIVARQAAEHRLAAAVQRAEEEAAARRESEERLREMKAELARLRRQFS